MREQIARVLGRTYDIVGSVGDGLCLLESAARLDPDVIVLDITMPGIDGFGAARSLKRAGCRSRLVFLTVHEDPDFAREAMSLGADAYHMKPIERDWLLETLERLIRDRPAEQLLVIDDDEVSRYLLRGLLADTRFTLVEASNAREGLYLAHQAAPCGIFLDLVMQGTDGFALLELLKSDPRTRDIPVFIHTSRQLNDTDRARLEHASAIVPKDGQSRQAQVAAVRNALVAAGLDTLRRKEVTR